VERRVLHAAADAAVGVPDDDPAGLVTELGSTIAARRWSFAGGPFTATGLGGTGPRVRAGFSLAVVMKVAATDQEISAVHYVLVHNGHVVGSRVHTVTRAAALANYKNAHRDNAALLKSVTAATMPVTFDVVATNEQWIVPLRTYFGSRSGVDTVVSSATERPQLTDDVVVFNPGPRAVHVSVGPTASGRTVSGPGMNDLLVAPGRQVTVSLVELDRKGIAVVVNATGPVVAERFTGGPWGVTRSPGVPWLSG